MPTLSGKPTWGSRKLEEDAIEDALDAAEDVAEDIVDKTIGK